MGLKDKLKGRKESKNILDLRDPKKLAKHNALTELTENAKENYKLSSKTPMAEQDDDYTAIVNYVNNNSKREQKRRDKNLTKKSLNEGDPAPQSGFNYNSQVTPGKFVMTNNLKRGK